MPLKTVLERFLDKVQISSGCWEWLGYRERRDGFGGYGRFKYNGGWGYAHRAAYELLVGPIPEGLDICHSCDNPGCVNPEHLFPGTHQDNMRDMFSKGRRHNAKGEHHPECKLTEQEVLEVRARCEHGDTIAQIARDYNIGRTQVYRIRDRISWAWL